jgi:hypothetical protein
LPREVLEEPAVAAPPGWGGGRCAGRTLRPTQQGRGDGERRVQCAELGGAVVDGRDGHGDVVVCLAACMVDRWRRREVLELCVNGGVMVGLTYGLKADAAQQEKWLSSHGSDRLDI